MNNYKEFLKSEWWLQFRETAYLVFNYKCYFCNSTKFLNLHHTKYFNTTLGKTKKKNHNNLRWFLLICHECHISIHKIQKENNYSVYMATKIFRNLYYPNKKMWLSKKKIRNILLKTIEPRANSAEKGLILRGDSDTVLRDSRKLEHRLLY